MKEFKVNSYLYMPLGTHESEIESIINDQFSSVNIDSIEVREFEVATDFDIIFEAESIDDAQELFLKAFEGYDVDNYVIEEV